MRQVKLALVAASLSVIFSQAAQAAVYEVVELPMQDISLRGFSSSINDAGDVSVVATGVFNPPIDLSLLDFESETLVNNLTDIESARQGNFNAVDLTFIAAFIDGQSSSISQQLASSQSYVVPAGATSPEEVTFIQGFDEIDPDFSAYSRSTDTRIRLLSNAGIAVGSSEGKFEKVPYTNESDTDITYVAQSHGLRAFVNMNGVNYGIAPETDAIGAVTEGFSINDNLLVAGYETVEPTSARINASANCLDDEERGDIPVEICQQQIINAGFLTGFQLRGALWQLNDQGEVVDRKILGLHITPAEDDTRIHISRALAVNNAGIAVGEATNFFQEDEDLPRTFAAVFRDDEVIGFTDHEEYFNSIAIDINNNNIAVGQASRRISGITRTKFFVYDVDADSVVYPEDFFPTSASVARDINDNNLVVGEGEVDSSINVTRRDHGFLYDIDNATFQNLNDLTSCDSPYTIVQANSINNSNQIAATAIIHRQAYNIKGEPAVDENDEPILDDAIVSVLLNPIEGGTIDECVDEPDLPDNQERSSGSLSWGALLIAGLIGFGRRRFYKG
ncbi:DUF3466 family protein [Alteromonas sp. a30]|uniref:DUF3466 family protein n=1 Tax=Alteromonas sp. a30 TaxID=2730917 RepID=UPI002281D6FB|nr:DUF3466 family protein [Alteromonas sp. a30]MCY7293897.1 DUF3466 family protein [Alteromonas sp. a30]